MMFFSGNLRAEHGHLNSRETLMKQRTPLAAIRQLAFAVLFLAGAMQTAHGQWSDPVMMDSNTDTIGINTGAKEWCPFVSADGSYFYFTRERTNNDIYVCHRIDSGWSVPLKLPFCQELIDERNPSVNPTNDTLYFISWAPGWDIFWSFRTGPEDTSWSQPEQMPEPINSTGIEFSVWATPDNERLLFASWRISANGEDIYECRRDTNTITGWSEPVPLLGELRTFDLESYPSMGMDTTKLYFWGRADQIVLSELVDSNWTFGIPLPPNINRVIIRNPSETTPCITPDGRRLYFASRWNGDSVATAGDIWYSERPSSTQPREYPQRVPRAGLNLEIFPNPTNSTFVIKMPSGIQHAALYDVLGRLLIEEDFQSISGDFFWKPQLERTHLATGVYLLHAEGVLGSQTLRINIVK